MLLKVKSKVFLPIVIIILLIFAGSAFYLLKSNSKIPPSPLELAACTVDSDCIPLPSECHPISCINKKYEKNYQKREACDLMYREEAAYTPEDCACQEFKCVNKKNNQINGNNIM